MSASRDRLPTAEVNARGLFSRPGLADPSAGCAPWLTRVAINIAKDRLRHRQSQAYIGPEGVRATSTDAAPFGLTSNSDSETQPMC